VTRLALALGALLGCDTAVHVQDLDAPPSAACLEATRHSDFAWIQANVLGPSCAAFTSCHQGGHPPGRLDLSADHAYANLVNVAEVTVPDWGVRVAPFDPDHSYLLVKVGVVAGPLGALGTTMPPNSPLLCAEKLDALRRWIAAGALESSVPDAPSAALPDASVAALPDGGAGPDAE
jgi:hypothetical protein